MRWDLPVIQKLGLRAESNQLRYDLIVACDTLIYFGDLSQVIIPATKLLNKLGAIAFSVERSEQPMYQLTDSGRYAHHWDHIKQVTQTVDLNIAYHQEVFLRTEYGEDVIGHVVVLSNFGIEK